MEIQRAFMPSPKHTYERLFYPDTSDSEKKKKKKKKREIERVERHATFRNPDGYEDCYDILSGKIASTRVLGEEDRR